MQGTIMTTKQPLLPNVESIAHELPEMIRTLGGVDFILEMNVGITGKAPSM